MRAASVLPLALGVAGAVVAAAETHVFLQNAGREPLCVEAAEVTGGLSADAWKHPSGGHPRPDLGCRYLVAPGERIEAVRLNRDIGVTDGHVFQVRTRVRTLDGHAIELRQRLRGQAIGSHMHQSVGDAPEVDDRRRRTSAWVAGERVIPVHYQALAAGTGFDDLEFVFGASRPMPTPSGAGLRLLALNAYMVPSFSEAIDARAHRLGQALGGYDVLVLGELFDDSARRVLLAALAGEYPYRTTVLNPDHGMEQDGGVVIASRWPILFQDELYYQGSSGADRLAAKGAMYARLQGPQGPLHVFGTHTQSAAHSLGDKALDGVLGVPVVSVLDTPRRIRERQFAQLREFVEAQAVPLHETVILAGDMNVDFYSRGGAEYRRMLEILGAREVPVIQRRPTFDPANRLVDDEATGEYLDYVLVRAHQAPLGEGSWSRVRPLLTDDPFDAGIRDLSDHYAIETLLLPGTEGRLVGPPVSAGGDGLLGFWER